MPLSLVQSLNSWLFLSINLHQLFFLSLPVCHDQLLLILQISVWISPPYSFFSAYPNVALPTWLVIPHSINLLIISGGSMVKEPACQCRRPSGDAGLIPWGRKWQPTPVFLPGKSRGQRSLAGYSPWGCKEWNMTEQLSTFIITYFVHLPMTCSFPYTQHVNSTRVGSTYALILLYVFCLAQCLSRVVVI